MPQGPPRDLAVLMPGEAGSPQQQGGRTKYGFVG